MEGQEPSHEINESDRNTTTNENLALMQTDELIRPGVHSTVSKSLVPMSPL